MNNFQVVKDEENELVRVYNKANGTFVKNHTQDVIKGGIAKRLENGDIRDNDGRVWYDDNNLAYESEKVGMRIICRDEQPRAIVAYALLIDEKADEDMDIEEILDSAPFVTVFDTKGKKILSLERYVSTTEDEYFASRDTLYQKEFNLRFGLDTIRYTMVSDNYLTHSRDEYVSVLDYNGRELFRKQRTEGKKTAQQRAKELMLQLESEQQKSENVL